MNSTTQAVDLTHVAPPAKPARKSAARKSEARKQPARKTVAKAGRKTEGKRVKNGPPTQVRMPTAWTKGLKSLAKQHNVKLSEELRTAVKNHLARNGQKAIVG